MNILSTMASQLLSANAIDIPTGSPDQVLGIILDLAYLVAGVIAVIILIVAGFKIMTASDPASTVKARNSINHAIIAIVIILSAFALTQFFVGRF